MAERSSWRVNWKLPSYDGTFQSSNRGNATNAVKRYSLVDARGRTVESATPGTLGGNRRLRIYGRLDCGSARRALARGYAEHRVFFADEATARAAGYRPCGVCMRQEYRAWRERSTDAATP